MIKFSQCFCLTAMTLARFLLGENENISLLACQYYSRGPPPPKESYALRQVINFSLRQERRRDFIIIFGHW